MARQQQTKRWKLKDGAPKHYVNGQGFKFGGDEFVGGPEPMSQWCVEVVPAKPSKPARQGKEEGAGSPAPSTESEQANEAASEAGDPPAGDPPSDGTF